MTQWIYNSFTAWPLEVSIVIVNHISLINMKKTFTEKARWINLSISAHCPRHPISHLGDQCHSISSQTVFRIPHGMESRDSNSRLWYEVASSNPACCATSTPWPVPERLYPLDILLCLEKRMELAPVCGFPVQNLIIMIQLSRQTFSMNVDNITIYESMTENRKVCYNSLYNKMHMAKSMKYNGKLFIGIYEAYDCSSNEMNICHANESFTFLSE